MLDERFARLAGAGDDIHHAFWQTRFLKDVREMKRGDAGGSRRFQHAGISAREREREFHAAMSNGKFQGIICPATPSDRALRPGNPYSSLSVQLA